MQPIQTQTYNGNSNLKKSGVQLEFTEEQVREIMRCKNDIIYFIKTYVKIISLDKGFVHFDLYPFQEEIVKVIEGNRFVLIKLPRQSGKCSMHSTEINIRNKKTGEIKKIKIGDFYNSLK